MTVDEHEPRDGSVTGPTGSPPEWQEPPSDIAPASVPTDRRIARGPGGAVLLSRLACYPNGIVFDLLASMPGESPGIPQSLLGPEVAMPHGTPQVLPAQALRLTVRYADGREATNFTIPDARSHWKMGQPPAALTWRGTRTFVGAAKLEWWLWPLPSSGDLEITCEWPILGIAATTNRIDGDLLRDAATRAIYAFD
jgi:hypothetical protein